jgi:hypothetical protein
MIGLYDIGVKVLRVLIFARCFKISYNSFMNILEVYKTALPEAKKKALNLLTQLADDMGVKMWLVGGIVRDILLERPFNDIDILIEYDAIIFAKLAEKKYSNNLKILAQNDKFKTAKLNFTIQNNYQKMPAPRRDTTLDPNVSDVKARIQKLYEKTTSKEEQINKPNTFREYETFEELQNYYNSQDIDFKIYKKPEGKVKHNTNKLLFAVEAILFGITGLASLLLYFLFNAVGGVNTDLSFLYYLFPIISFVFLSYKFYNYKFGISRLPKSMYKDVFIIAIFLLGSISIFCFSLVCGLSLVNPVTYCTCIIYPILILGVWLVVRHYLTLYFYKRFWR